MTDRRPELPAIEVEAAVAAEAGMPEDLNANVFGPYEVPDPVRRRRAGLVYFVGAAITAAGILAGLPTGMWIMAAVFLVVGIYHVLAGRHLEVREVQALTTANKATDFAVGHASAVLGFDGLLARPVWNVLVFSSEEPPTRRGLVRVDGQSGTVVEIFTEVIPPPD
jgi:hypothetical protein